MWQTLIDKLVSILEANTLIGEVFSFEVEEFKNDPTCTVTPSENSSDYNTTEENVRIYAFNVRLFVNRTVLVSGKDTKYEADRKMRNLVDSVMDDFDKQYYLSGIVNPTGYTFINLFATPSMWGYAGRESEFRFCEIKLQCRVSVDLNAIS